MPWGSLIGMKLAHKTVLEVLGVLIPGMIITIEVLALLAPAATLTRTALNNRRAFRGLAGWVCETFRHAGYERARA